VAETDVEGLLLRLAPRLELSRQPVLSSDPINQNLQPSTLNSIPKDLNSFPMFEEISKKPVLSPKP
jgi:hypothetical protein